ncbi:MAG: DUF4465 domain-containing protein [Alistipes sp.]|nr:DUF4465 domain-containing protein [Alistipes sp.]
MKTMRYFAIAAAVAALAGCSKQEPAQIETPEADHEVYLTVRASSADTRTAISPDYAIRWAEGDAIGLFYNTDEIQAEWGFSEGSYTLTKGTTQNLYYPIASGVGTSAADFSYKNYIVGPVQHPASGFYSGNFYWQGEASQTTQATLYAYYPYYYDTYCISNYNVEYMPFLLPRVQEGSLESVAAYDLACASATIMRGDGNVVKGEANFNFKHLFSILEITVENTLSDAVTVESVTVSAAAGTALTGDCTLDLTKGVVTMGKKAGPGSTSAGVSQPSVMLSPAEGVVVPSKETTKLYAVVAPCDLSGATVRVTTPTGYYEFSVSGIVTESGKYYTKNVSLADGKFVATEDYTITFDEDYYNNHVAANIVGEKYYTYDVSGKYTQYWVDPVTKLSTKKPEGENLYSDFVYPFFVSSYNSSSLDSDTFGSYNYDLVVYNVNASEGIATSKGGRNGSDNFLVGNGYRDEQYYVYYGDSRPILFFADGVSRIIKSVWVNYTTYFMNVALNGNGPSQALKEGEDCMLTVTGYDIDDTETGSVKMTYAQKDHMLSGWTELDLSELGPIVKVRFNLSGGPKNGSGFSLPAYYALDDITVTQEKK